MTTFVSVPKFNPVPNHPLFHRFRIGGIVRQVEELIEWSKQEHTAALKYYSRIGDMRTFAYLAREFSYIRVLALCSEFYSICELLSVDEEAWNALDKRTRKDISYAYEFARKSRLV